MKINKEILKAIKDCLNDDMPRDTNSFGKIKCSMENGTRVWWYYKDDVEYAKECGENPRDVAPFGGITISLPGQEYSGTIEENIIVVVDTEPVEKCYPEIGWVALDRLIDDKDLIEVFCKE